MVRLPDRVDSATLAGQLGYVSSDDDGNQTVHGEVSDQPDGEGTREGGPIASGRLLCSWRGIPRMEEGGAANPGHRHCCAGSALALA